jgi:hypothetical protein
MTGTERPRRRGLIPWWRRRPARQLPRMGEGKGSAVPALWRAGVHLLTGWRLAGDRGVGGQVERPAGTVELPVCSFWRQTITATVTASGATTPVPGSSI